MPAALLSASFPFLLEMLDVCAIYALTSMLCRARDEAKEPVFASPGEPSTNLDASHPHFGHFEEQARPGLHYQFGYILVSAYSS